MRKDKMISRFFHRAVSKVYFETRARLKYSIAKNSIKVLGDLKYINLPEGEVVVVLLARDMSHYLEEFYEYYAKLGAEYFIYLDNGSSDNSLEIVHRWKNAIVLSSDLNFRLFQNELRQIIATEYCSNGWRLAVDPDEQFDYIGSETLGLQGFVKTLSSDGYDGLVAQMLDLVPEYSLSQLSYRSFRDSIKSHLYYSLDDIKNFGYFDPNVPFHGLVKNNLVSGEEVSWKFGGIRKTYFGEECCLSKHPLFLYKSGVKPFVHPHLTTGLKLADFTALLRHYKFSGNYLDRETRLIAEQRISHGETVKRSAVMDANENFRFDTTNLFKDPSPRAAVENGFLTMSDRAKRRYL